MRLPSHQPTQFNNNITLMINHFGPPLTQEAEKDKAQSAGRPLDAKAGDKHTARPEVSGESASPSKSVAAKKNDHGGGIDASNSNVSFKQSKPQRIAPLQVGQGPNALLSSRGVTPSNQQPLISASNLLIQQSHGGAMPNLGYGNSQGMFTKKGQGLGHLWGGTPRLFLGNINQNTQK